LPFVCNNHIYISWGQVVTPVVAALVCLVWLVCLWVVVVCLVMVGELVVLVFL